MSDPIARVEAKREFAVTRRGKPFARLVAADHVDATEQHTRVVDGFRQLAMLRRQVSLEGDLNAIARDGLDWMTLVLENSVVSVCLRANHATHSADAARPEGAGVVSP